MFLSTVARNAIIQDYTLAHSLTFCGGHNNLRGSLRLVFEQTISIYSIPPVEQERPNLFVDARWQHWASLLRCRERWTRPRWLCGVMILVSQSIPHRKPLHNHSKPEIRRNKLRRTMVMCNSPLLLRLFLLCSTTTLRHAANLARPIAPLKGISHMLKH